jgi:SAM-dependent methyltransferase
MACNFRHHAVMQAESIQGGSRLRGANDHYSSPLAVAAYDLFHGGGMLEGDIDFYLDCAKQYSSPILEIGAGTGRVLFPLADAGHEVVGLDSSDEMLKIAAEKVLVRPDLAGRVQLTKGDMRDFDLTRQFPQVIVSARSFQHLLSPADQREALRCIHRHLTPGGHLVLDLFDPYFELLFAKDIAPSQPREEGHPKSGMRIRRTLVARQNDPMQQTIREVLLYEAFDQGGSLVASEETSWTLRWSIRQEMAYLLELCGFEIVELFSDFKRSPPSYAREQLWVARKA